jgi:hypothetical protein
MAVCFVFGMGRHLLVTGDHCEVFDESIDSPVPKRSSTFVDTPWEIDFRFMKSLSCPRKTFSMAFQQSISSAPEGPSARYLLPAASSDSPMGIATRPVRYQVRPRAIRLNPECLIADARQSQFDHRLSVEAHIKLALPAELGEGLNFRGLP